MPDSIIAIATREPVIDRRAQHFTFDACRGLAATLNEAADMATRLIARMKEMPGADLGKLHEAFGTIYDELSSEAGRIEQALDNEHLPSDLVSIDLSEVGSAVDGMERV